MDFIWSSYRRTERKTIRKARSPGSAFFIMVVVVAALVGFVSVGVSKAVNMEFKQLDHTTGRMQAQNFAVSEAEYLRALKYHDLDLLTYDTKQPIQDSDYYKLLTISPEDDYSKNVKRRVINIQIFKGADSTAPAFEMEINRYYNGTGNTNSANK